MKPILSLAVAGLVACTLAACSPGAHGRIGYNVDFHNGELVSHAPGQPNAHISRDGDLSIGGKPVAVTPAQRELLRRYYQQAQTVVASGEVIGKQGIQMAKSGIDQAVASIFSKDSPAADKQMDAQSQKIEAAADALCASVQALGTTEKTLASELPAFKPYADNDRAQCRTTHTVVVRHDNGTTTTTKTSSFVVSTGRDSAKPAAAAQPHTVPASETSHQP